LLGTAIEQWQFQANPLAGRLNQFARLRVNVAYRWRHGRWPDLENPRRFTEWVQWRKLEDRDAERAKLTDKAHSKRLAAAALGHKFVIPTLWQGKKLPVVPPWPMPFIVKANHGCGQFVIVKNVEDYRRALQLSPKWMKSFYGGWLDEWHYRGARQAILVEPLIGEIDTLPIDYKIYVFGGRAAMIQVHEGRGTTHRWAQYDRRWTKLSRRAAGVGAPRSLTLMIDAAERLSVGHDFLRADFYEVDGQPLFGEFCLYPGSGLDPFDPPELDDWLGVLWRNERPRRLVSNCIVGAPRVRQASV
jgi:TupA-like ATPgrasp